ncbi:hypothetical protein [Streptomyces sp. NBC_01198]|uniref:hypothetical protein n=1 Tax=Streptomyces sp. NBC_01198 TaxID=2903769 RepID=UPI002E157FA0|nr:hypothetical protein OG702_10565 [Streptomyces sp. NBC_01198]
MRRLFRAVYGESVLHLLVLLASFALCGYAITRLLERDAWGVAEWVVGSALIHDVVLVPLYGGADWLLHMAARGRRPGSPARIALVNHIRVPTFISLLLLLVYWPLISHDAGATYRNATLLSPGVFLGRWLLITAVLFAASALLLVFRRWRAARGNRG